MQGGSGWQLGWTLYFMEFNQIAELQQQLFPQFVFFWISVSRTYFTPITMDGIHLTTRIFPKTKI